MKDKKRTINRAGGISRRSALCSLAGAGGLAWSLLRPGPARAQFRGPNFFEPEVPERPTFFFGQVVYGTGLSWNPYPTSARSLMEILVKRTSVLASPDRVDLRLGDPKLFHYPFLYWTGAREFDPLPEADVQRLKTFLEFGGFMLVDDALSASGIGFDQSFQRELSRIFPGETLAKLPEDHTVFQSYYLISRVVGRASNRPFLSGITRGERTPLIYSANDLGGAWAREASGRWVNNVEPGGEGQREMAVRLGINIVLYALCVNYKKDLIHVPFISERRSGRRPRP
ncbi:MAG TPA: DUF4159 domain-containing protein [bacterium]|nr:DUF4159 domain-containing protein [bacterium]